MVNVVVGCFVLGRFLALFHDGLRNKEHHVSVACFSDLSESEICQSVSFYVENSINPTAS